MGIKMLPSTDEHWMQHALKLAEHAASIQEVPVGAVLVFQNQVIGQGYNQSITHHDPTAHAEIVALREGAKHLGNYRLPETTLYVTLEPCMMCVGAIIHARIKRLVFGARDNKSGAVVSAAMLLNQQFLNHHVDYREDILSEKCGHLLRQFFKARRKKVCDFSSAELQKEGDLPLNCAQRHSAG